MGNNKIIALSGQPVTGKGTNVNAIIEKFKKQGYSEENIHVISTGHEFRNYFNHISEFIKHYQNPEELERLAQDEYLKVFAEKKEYREVLINTILKLKQNNIDVNNLSIEEANNLKEFSGLRKVVDKIIDTRTEEIVKEFNSIERPNEVLILDSRVAFMIKKKIKEALSIFSVRLISDPKVAAQRLFNDQNRGKEDNKYKSIQEAYEAREKRRIGEQKRYLKRYGVDLEDENNYDLIIDTSYSTIDDISNTILKCLDCYTKGETFAKKWTSPKMLLPLQRETTTLAKGEWGKTFEEISEIIKLNGYNPDSEIEVVDVDGYLYIINGHHRCFGAAYAENTLIPYTVIAKDDEILPGEYRDKPTETARQRIEKVRSEKDLIGHSWMISDNFSHEEVYPGIYNKFSEKDKMER